MHIVRYQEMKLNKPKFSKREIKTEDNAASCVSQHQNWFLETKVLEIQLILPFKTPNLQFMHFK